MSGQSRSGGGYGTQIVGYEWSQLAGCWVCVAVLVAVAVGVAVGVDVTVGVSVGVAVAVGVSVGSGACTAGR